MIICPKCKKQSVEILKGFDDYEGDLACCITQGCRFEIVIKAKQKKYEIDHFVKEYKKNTLTLLKVEEKPLNNDLTNFLKAINYLGIDYFKNKYCIDFYNYIINVYETKTTKMLKIYKHQIASIINRYKIACELDRLNMHERFLNYYNKTKKITIVTSHHNVKDKIESLKRGDTSFLIKMSYNKISYYDEQLSKLGF